MVCNRQSFKNVSKSKTVAPNSDSCKNVDLDNECSGENEEFIIENESCESDGSENKEEAHVEDLATPGICVDDDKKTRHTVSNRYDMVFAPFTGVDNHKKCITFGVGLLSKEDVESYVWLFRYFLNAMGRELKCIITDQDPSMKIAIPHVFTKSCHRFCMWHIMEKDRDIVLPHFFVLKEKKVNSIPDRYVLRRWCKDSILKPLNAFEAGIFQQCLDTEEQNLAMKTLWSDIHFCVGMIDQNPQMFQQFADAIKVQKDLLSTSQGNSASGSTKNDVFKAFYGSFIPTQVSVRPPQQARNKGCGKRIKGGKEKAIEVSQKSKRICRKCNKKGYHDSRNCPLNSDE
ncbi:unnamed protein product [Cuscuta europaea]|uniref:MULE transposase domain-containing protein n=1 Tax=Cuscuta europaea TaxID=41803 RepID=A0A9P0ZCR4_CUSEU|nr:unnamed protein product [Cuscuta europaea]